MLDELQETTGPGSKLEPGVDHEGADALQNQRGTR
jgi:hypothetical protein